MLDEHSENDGLSHYIQRRPVISNTPSYLQELGCGVQPFVGLLVSPGAGYSESMGNGAAASNANRDTVVPVALPPANLPGMFCWQWHHMSQGLNHFLFGVKLDRFTGAPQR